ncbi:MAG TPA: hypothetical protein VHU92_01845 [Streptosporangiaceae bacterium]|nr:hypothetical protein [Streptosporangiaceae bacterium]
MTGKCGPTQPNLVPLYKLVVRTFTTGAQYVSHGGATPHQVGRDLVATAWSQ